MPKYMTLFKYSPEGTKGLLKEGAAGRVAALKQAAESGGGSVESVNFITGGEFDGVIVSESPDLETFTAYLLLGQSTGALANARTFRLLTSEEVDRGLAKKMTYRAPGA
jgi:uncharacterized protein with GYD domain